MSGFIKDLLSKNKLLPLMVFILPLWIVTELIDVVADNKPKLNDSFYWLYERY